MHVGKGSVCFTSQEFPGKMVFTSRKVSTISETCRNTLDSKQFLRLLKLSLVHTWLVISGIASRHARYMMRE